MPSLGPSRSSPVPAAGAVASHCRQLEEARVRERRLSVRLRETYVELQRERRSWEDLQVEREAEGRAREALEGEVASLRAQLEQGDGRALVPGAQETRVVELQELLGQVEGAQASLVRRRGWLVGSVAAARGEAMHEWLILLPGLRTDCFRLGMGALSPVGRRGLGLHFYLPGAGLGAWSDPRQGRPGC